MKKRLVIRSLAAIAYLALALIAAEWWLSPPKGALDANGRRLTPGMTLEEVEAILGSHSFTPSVPENGPCGMLFYNVEGGVVDIELIDRRLVSASWCDPSPALRSMHHFRNWLGWRTAP